MIERQLRVGFSGPVGLDLPACIAVAVAGGVDAQVAALLLPYVEAGLMAAFANARG